MTSPPTRPAIRAEGLTKRFGKKQALAGVDLEAAPGTVLGVLGPNGAGKTTTVRVLSTLLRPDGGRAWMAGHDVLTAPEAVRRDLGLSGQYAAVDEKLTGRENLYLVGRLYGMGRHAARRRAGQLLGEFDLEDAADQPSGTYSGGMRRRLDLAGALVARPSVVVLDEPTTGLDPRGRADTWQAVRNLVAEGTTVLLTTQYLEEADQLADAIVVIESGTVVARGSAAELKARVAGSGSRSPSRTRGTTAPRPKSWPHSVITPPISTRVPDISRSPPTTECRAWSTRSAACALPGSPSRTCDWRRRRWTTCSSP